MPLSKMQSSRLAAISDGVWAIKPEAFHKLLADATSMPDDVAERSAAFRMSCARASAGMGVCECPAAPCAAAGVLPRRVHPVLPLAYCGAGRENYYPNDAARAGQERARPNAGTQRTRA